MSSFDFTDSYGHLSALIDELGLACSAAFVHGSLCGLLTVGTRFASAEWLDLALSEPDLASQLPPEAHSELSEFAQHQQAQLHTGLLGLAPLLPDDESALTERVKALHDWCDGYLGGLGLSGNLKKNTALSRDLRDALRDLQQIVSSEIELDANDQETDENAYMELYEYVRAVIDLAFQELAPRTVSTKGSELRH
jgi:uncharacterized protein